MRKPLTDEQKEAKRIQVEAWRIANPEKAAARSRRWREAHPDRAAEVCKKWKDANPESVKKNNKKWHEDNKERAAAKERKWRAANPAKVTMKAGRRRASRLLATPLWANEFIISEAYELAQMRTKVTGIVWHVDHVVPLTSKLVCGLHCEHNIRVIPGSENIAKNNRYWPDMPC